MNNSMQGWGRPLSVHHLEGTWKCWKESMADCMFKALRQGAVWIATLFEVVVNI